jgi:hypothetical protein
MNMQCDREAHSVLDLLLAGEEHEHVAGVLVQMYLDHSSDRRLKVVPLWLLRNSTLQHRCLGVILTTHDLQLRCGEDAHRKPEPARATGQAKVFLLCCPHAVSFKTKSGVKQTGLL